MEVRRAGQAETDEGQEGGDGVDDEERRERSADVCREIELVVLGRRVAYLAIYIDRQET